MKELGSMINRRTTKDDLLNLHDYGINVKTREIYLHPRMDLVEEMPGVEYGMAAQFIKNLNFLCNQNDRNILVTMQTCGGDWNYGIGIYDGIIASKSPVTIVAYAHARSMSSIILQAADKRVFMPHTEFMVHFGTQGDDNGHLNFVAGAEFSKVSTQRMLKVYAKRCILGEHFQKRYKSLTEDKVMQYIDRMIKEKGDWWLRADEAVYYGFGDGIFGDKGFENLEKIRTNKKFCW